MATEKRLIDANALIDEWNTLIKKMRKDSDGAYPVDFAIVISAISKANTVDAVEVVRCKDCKYWKPGDSKGGNSIEDLQVIGGCKWTNFCRREMDFCSFGERKDNAM